MRYDTPDLFPKSYHKVSMIHYYRRLWRGYSRMKPDVWPLSDTRTETMQIVYGSIKQGSKTIHIQNHYDKSYDSIRIDNKIYRVDYSRTLRNKHSFIVHEVQNG